jgi:hypothetical protein
MEVREAYHIARWVSDTKQKESFYSSLGLDMERVETLYPSVQHLEDAMDHSREPRSFRIWGWRITISRESDTNVLD